MSRSSRRQFLRTGAAWAGAGAFSILARGKARAETGRGRPNLLLVFPDQLRPDWTSLDPDLPVRTPHVARLAREGLRFDQVYCPSPVCAPSRACLAQGRRYGRTGVRGNEDDNPAGIRTFYQGLRDAGYRVASIGKLDLRKHAYDWGPDGLHRVGDQVFFREWGFTDGFDSEGKIDVVIGWQRLQAAGRTRPDQQNPYARMLAERRDGSLEIYLGWYRAWRAGASHYGNYADTAPCALPGPAYNDNWVGANALRLVEDELPADRPWFLQVNFPGPHNPEDITAPMAAWYRGVQFPQPFRNDQYPPAVHEAIRRNYSAMVTNIDGWLGRLLEALDRRGLAERTYVVFSSDHGEMLGDHDRWGKTLPYEASAAVPLIVRGPGVAPGTVHRSLATTLDLPATFLALAGAPVPAGMDSRSLLPVWLGSATSSRPHVVSALEPWRMVRDRRYKLVRGFDPEIPGGNEAQIRRGRPQFEAPVLLYDLERDPDETENVAARRPEVVARLDRLLPPAPRGPGHSEDRVRLG